jgi:hypothetical protein
VTCEADRSADFLPDIWRHGLLGKLRAELFVVGSYWVVDDDVPTYRLREDMTVRLCDVVDGQRVDAILDVRQIVIVAVGGRPFMASRSILMAS